MTQKKIEAGALVEFDGAKGTVKQVISKPSFLIEGLDGKEILVAATEVKRLPSAEQIAFWRERALLAEGKARDEGPIRSVSVPGDDENPYTAQCTECEFTQQFPDEANAAGDMMKAGWRFEGGSTICPSHRG
jgi:hypothetical protein